MSRNYIPINIQKIKVQNTHSRYSPVEVKEEVKYLISIEEKGEKWSKTIVCNFEDLIDFREKINRIIDGTTTSEILNISLEQAMILDGHYDKDPLCQKCKYKLSPKCIECIFILQSPLERLLFLELTKEYITFHSQHALNWQGEPISTNGRTYDNPNHNFKDVLTIVDFYIEKRDKKLCIYTDGHSYHERTEEQAQKDRNIDRKLQALGFKVLRYTGKDVKENIDKIIGEIKHWINNV